LKHSVSRKEAEELFFNQPLLVNEDLVFSLKELRLQALGKTSDGRLLFISFTVRGGLELYRLEIKAKKRDLCTISVKIDYN